ncbi:MAG: leucine-rich repeat protein [Eubacterium sp.]
MKKVKQLLSLFLSAIMLFSITAGIDLSAYAINQGVCGDYVFEVLDEHKKTAEIVEYQGYGGDVTIPITVNGYKVIKIGDYVFENCDTLRKLTIPYGVTLIGIWVCNDCNNLSEIVIPNSVVSIGGHSFSKCPLLKSIYIPESIKYIACDNGGGYRMCEYNCFYDCESLTAINVSEKNTNYSSKDGVLFNKDKTRLLIYPDGKEGDYVVPNTVNIINDSSFYGAKYLKEVTLPCSVTRINGFSFEGCNNLEAVNMATSIKLIYGNAFLGCDKLKNIYYEGTFDEWRNINIFTDEGNIEISFLNANINYDTDNSWFHTVKNSLIYNNSIHFKQCECGKIKTDIEKHIYKNIITKATSSANGNTVTKCSVCGEIKSNSTIYYPKTITLSTTTYTYDGKVKKPTVKVVGSNGKTISSSNYTISYTNGRKNVGQYAVTIKFKGNYSGTVKKAFTIKPKATSISKITSGKKKFTVKWKKQASQTTGYQIQYSTSSKFSNAKTVTVSKNKITSKTISKLKAKKKYYVRIRTYKTANGKKYYSAWSKAKSITTKK